VLIGGWLVTFRDISGQSSRVRVSKKNARNMYIFIYMGNGVGSEWFSVQVVLAVKHPLHSQTERFYCVTSYLTEKPE
jgi:hypothetical protein